MTKRTEVILAIISVIIIALIIWIIWAIQTKKITPFAAIAHPAVLSFSPVSGEYPLSANFDIDIVVDVENIQSSGIDVIVNYDISILEVQDADQDTRGIQIKEGTLFPNYFVNSVNADEGRIKVSAAMQDEPVNIVSSSIFATITFKAKEIIDKTVADAEKRLKSASAMIQ